MTSRGCALRLTPAAAWRATNTSALGGANLPPPPSAETITLYLGTVYANGTAISSDSMVDYTGATAKIEFGGHMLPVSVSGTVGAWVFGIQMSTDDQANLVPSEASYTLVPRLSVRQYDSPPVSTGMLRLMTSL